MTYFRRLFILVMTLPLFTSLSSAVVFAQDPANGKVLWEEQIWQCQQCHGPAGEGLYGGPRAGDEKTAQEWITQVRTPRRFMPSFSPEQVSDEQIIDMHAYLTSLPKPAGEFMPKDPGTAENEGQNLLLQKRCVACHSEANGEVGFVAERRIESGQPPTAEDVIKQLRTPFKNMPSFSADQVSDEEAALIADFLAELVTGQTPPSALPQSGSTNPVTLPVVVLFIGGGLLVAGVILRRLRVQP